MDNQETQNVIAPTGKELMSTLIDRQSRLNLFQTSFNVNLTIKQWQSISVHMFDHFDYFIAKRRRKLPYDNCDHINTGDWMISINIFKNKKR